MEKTRENTMTKWHKVKNFRSIPGMYDQNVRMRIAPFVDAKGNMYYQYKLLTEQEWQDYIKWRES